MEACASAHYRGREIGNLRHDDLDFVAVSEVAPLEADLLAGKVNEKVVGDFRFVRVTPKAVQRLTRVRELGLDIDHPVLESERVRQVFEGVTAVIGIETQLAFAASAGERIEILPPKDLRQQPSGQQNSLPGRGGPAFLVGTQAAIVDDSELCNEFSEISWSWLSGFWGCRPSPVPDWSSRISGLAGADCRQSFPCCCVFLLPYMPAPIPRRKRTRLHLSHAFHDRHRPLSTFAEGSVSASRVARPARRSLAFRPRMFSGPLNAVLCHRSASACAVASADRLGCSRPKRQWLGGSRSHWGNALSTAHRRIFFTQLEILHTIVVACFRRRTCLFLNPVRNGIPGMEVEGNGRQESWECPVHRFR